MEKENKKIIYAGFFTRLLATLVDIFIILLILSIVMLALETFAIEIKNMFVPMVIWWLYSTIMITKWKATIGGKVFGIEVLNSKLEALSFKPTTFRFFLSIAPFALYVLFRGMQHDMELVPSPTIQQLPQLLFLLPPLLMFFTDKKQMAHDLLAHSIVVDSSKMKHTKEKSSMYLVEKLLRVVGVLIFLTFAGYMIFYVSIFYILGKQSYDAYNSSFEHNYTTNDYNDSRIIFYNQELEANSQRLVEASGIYEIFEADVKNDLALNCIKYFLAREHNVSDWIEMGSGFRKNARNKYANTKALIKKAKKNESHMGKYFHYYDLNDVNQIIDDIADVWKKDANTKTCQKMLPTDQMYTMFVMRYIENREEALERSKRDYQSAKPSGVPNKSFYKKNIEETSQWLKILYEKHPEYSIYRQEQQSLEQKQKQKRAEKKYLQHKKNIADRQKNIWEIMQKGHWQHSSYYEELDLNIRNSKGQTPLMIAVQNGHSHIIDSLRATNIDIWAKDSKGKTAFDYIKRPSTKREKILADRMFGSLRMLEVELIISNKARTIQASYSNKTDLLKIHIAGADCKDFNFPKNTQCKSN